MNTIKIFFLSLISIIFLTFSSCGSDDIDIPNEEEVITILEYNLTSTTGAPATFIFNDPDGDGGIAPTFSTQNLSANTTYTGTLTLLNGTTDPVTNINTEIAEEKEEHQFFFSSTIADLVINYSDTDADGKPVGLSTTLTTGAAGSGTLRIVLRHEPDKSAAGVAAGDISNAGGETDIEVVFDIVVE